MLPTGSKCQENVSIVKRSGLWSLHGFRRNKYTRSKKKKKITREGQLMMLILNGKLKTKYYEADKWTSI